MDCSKPGLPVPHRLPKFAQVHVHCISDAIQSFQPLTPCSPSALSLSQYQGLFQWVSCWHQVTKVLALQLQHQSFQWVFSVDLSYDWLVSSPCCSRGVQESSPAPQFESINKHQFSSIQLLSRVWLFVTSWTAAQQASLSMTNAQSLLKPMSIE